MNHWADYVIFAIFLVASMGIGLHHAFTGGKQRTNEEFIMANRKLKTIPTTISIVVSYMSALTIVGGPAEMYSYGFALWPGFILSGVISCLLSIYIFIPWIYPLKLTSVYSYFFLRYGNRAIQTYATLLSILASIIYTGVAIYAPSITMETATGFPAKLSIPIIAGVSTIYTTLGGMRAVIWTDVFQSTVMFCGMLTIMIKALLVAGGISESFETLKLHGRLGFDFSPDPTRRHTFWTFLIGWPLGHTLLKSLAQPSVQRYSALSSLKDAQKMIWLWLLGTNMMAAFSYLTGLLLFAYYAHLECDPLASHQISNSNQIMALFVTQVFEGYHGFSGLFIATLYSATLSTVSSTLSGAAAIGWVGIIEPSCPQLPEHRAVLISKCLVIVFGVLSAGFAYSVTWVQGPLMAVCISLVTACSGPLFGMFLVSGIKAFKHVHWKCVLCGGICALVVISWLTIGAITVDGNHPSLPPASTAGCSAILNVTDWRANITQHYMMDNTTSPFTGVHTPMTGLARFYSLSYLYYVLFGTLVTFFVTFLTHVVSLLFVTPIEPQDIREDLFIHVTLKSSHRGRKDEYCDVVAQKWEDVPLK